MGAPPRAARGSRCPGRAPTPGHEGGRTPGVCPGPGAFATWRYPGLPVTPRVTPCEAGLVLGPAGSRPALCASLCLLFGGIPGNSAPGTTGTNLWNSSHNKLGGRKAHTPSCSTVKWGCALPFPAVSLFVLSSFLPPVRALLCGRLPHRRYGWHLAAGKCPLPSLKQSTNGGTVTPDTTASACAKN